MKIGKRDRNPRTPVADRIYQLARREGRDQLTSDEQISIATERDELCRSGADLISLMTRYDRMQNDLENDLAALSRDKRLERRQMRERQRAEKEEVEEEEELTAAKSQRRRKEAENELDARNRTKKKREKRERQEQKADGGIVSSLFSP